MVKEKLIEMRKSKGFTKKAIAEILNMHEANYLRREQGQTRIHIDEWLKLAEIFNVPLEDIYESDDKQVFICNENAIGNIFGATYFTNVPKGLIETLIDLISDQKQVIKELKNK
jgi:transcriptional regulator with XRE-family HTH domain